MTKRPGLTVVEPSATGIPPPRQLGEHGTALWRRIQAAYVIDDPAGIEILAQACAAVDRAESLRELIDRDGPMIRTSKGGPLRDHPALRHELGCRAFICRCLSRLGLDSEPLYPRAGRPGPRPFEP
jgi:P27 family predicted phage terminase small subunit